VQNLERGPNRPSCSSSPDDTVSRLHETSREPSIRRDRMETHLSLSLSCEIIKPWLIVKVEIAVSIGCTRGEARLADSLGDSTISRQDRSRSQHAPKTASEIVSLMLCNTMHRSQRYALISFKRPGFDFFSGELRCPDADVPEIDSERGSVEIDQGSRPRFRE